MRTERGVISKQFLSLIILAIFIALLFFIWWRIHDPETLPIKWVKVQGTYQKVKQEQLEQALLPLVTTGFFDISVENIKQRLLSFPWIADARVRRIWPDTVIVGFREQEPIAKWNEQSLLNKNGEIFTPNASLNQLILPQLYGPNSQATQVLAFYQLSNEELLRIGLKALELDLSPRRAWHMTLSNGIQLFLGRVDITARLLRFIDIYPKAFAEKANQIDYIDVRYPNGLAVHWKKILVGGTEGNR